FFQAEDGIRGRTVTGVQTCALPIFGPGEAGRREVGAAARDPRLGHAGGEAALEFVAPRGRHGRRRDEREPGDPVRVLERVEQRRSEERRVGKEWGGRASPAE